MKKLLCICLGLMLMLTVCAFAEEETVSMQVVNCEEWVSLRAEPDNSSERLCKVPLGDTVRDCEPYSSEWIYAVYGGLCGYIRAEYLTASDDGMYYAPQACVFSMDELAGEEILRYEENGYTVVAARETDDAGIETLRVGCFADMQPVWGWTVRSDICTELYATDAFIGGDGEYRQVLISNSMNGLTAVDFYDGTENWTQPMETVDLGGCVCHAVDANGVSYIAGYYGPDPVAVSMDGEVLWESNVGDVDIFWPYRMVLAEDALYTRYGSDIGDGEYFAAYDYATGETLRTGLAEEWDGWEEP